MDDIGSDVDMEIFSVPFLVLLSLSNSSRLDSFLLVKSDLIFSVLVL